MRESGYTVYTAASNVLSFALRSLFSRHLQIATTARERRKIEKEKVLGALLYAECDKNKRKANKDQKLLL